MRVRYIPILAALFLIVGIGVQAFVSYSRAKYRLQEWMGLQMQIAQEKLLFELYDAYQAGSQLKDVVEENTTHPERIIRETYEFIKRYPNFYTCYVSFPPYYYPAKGKWYCPSSYRVNDSIFSDYFGDEQHDYFTREWYKGAVQSEGTGYWSQPYMDDDFDEPIFTYSEKMLDKHGKLLCVIGVDFSVNWTKRLLEQFRPFDEAVIALYSSNGALLTASDDIKSGKWQTKDDDDELFDERYWVITRKTLQPIGINMVTAIPKRHIWKSLRLGVLLSLGVFLLGIIVIVILLHRLTRGEQENARLSIEKRVMEHELQIAHDIQMGILKDEHRTRNDEPWTKDIELHAALLPMREVGGDLYDFHCENDELWFIIGDVSGKGVAAALFMSAAVNLFRAAGRHASSPKDLMEEMNAVLSNNNPSFIFVTAFIGRLRISSGELLYCNAGHVPPLTVDSKKSQSVYLPLIPNIPLGYDGHFQFVEQSCMLGEGEELVLYTDGVTEARNSERKMLGRERWAEIVTKEGRGDLLEQVKAYIGHADPTDDITLMTIRKLSPMLPVTLKVPNSGDQWPILRRAIHDFGTCINIEKKTLKKLEVAAEEAVVNILHYSQATEIEMRIEKESAKDTNPKLILTLIDDGIPFDPTAHKTNHKATDERQIGGMGISLIRQIADEMRYQRLEDKNQLTIIKQL